MDIHKPEIIREILLELNGCTGEEYQRKLYHILKPYYKSLGKIFEMPDSAGGDFKNDGWVKTDKIFYQIYAPYQNKSIRQNILNKFKGDLTGLIENIYNKKMWGGELKFFYFLVNTAKNQLPAYPNNEIEEIIKEIKEKYRIELIATIENNEYIENLLYEEHIDIELLKKILFNLRGSTNIYNDGIKETEVRSIIGKIANNIAGNYTIKNINTDYSRISTDQKIYINDLLSKKNDIENIIDKLDLVDTIVSDMNKDIIASHKFELVRDFVVSTYEELANEFHGVELYEKIIEKVSYKANVSEITPIVEYLIVYIFDKCDIFEKE